MSFLFQGQAFETVQDARWAAAKIAEGFTLADKGCDWLVEYVPEPIYDAETGEVDFWDDPQLPIRECGAVLVHTEDRWECAAGHQHVSAQARDAEGWEYAEDAEEARRLVKAGVEPRDLVTGGPVRF